MGSSFGGIRFLASLDMIPVIVMCSELELCGWFVGWPCGADPRAYDYVYSVIVLLIRKGELDRLGENVFQGKYMIA